MTANPWVIIGASLTGSIGSMFGVFYTPLENPHLFWLVRPRCPGAGWSLPENFFSQTFSVLPVTAVRALAVTEAVHLYGRLVVFGLIPPFSYGMRRDNSRQWQRPML